MQDPNYVAKLRVNVLRAKGLKPLGHIFDFATLRIKCCRQHLMRESRSSGSVEGVVSNHDPYSDCDLE